MNLTERIGKIPGSVPDTHERSPLHSATRV